MNFDELQKRINQLDSNLSGEAVALLQLVVRLSAEGKVKNSIMQNEIPDLLGSVERSEKLYREIEKRKFFLQFAKLINSTSSVKLKLSNNTRSNSRKKSEVDEKINSLVSKINKLLREDTPLDIDFKYQIISDGIKILSYSGLTFDVLKIPETIEGRSVVAIAERAFQGNSMRVVQLPSCLLELGEGAFQNCINLESVTLPPNLSSISDNCFENCTSLREIIFNDGLSTIGKSAFHNVAATKITIPKSVRAIYDNAFQVSVPIKALFEVKSKNLYVSESAFSGTAILYYRHSEIEEILKKTPAKISGNVAEFIGDSTGSTLYKIRYVVKNILIWSGAAVVAVAMLLFSFIRTPVGLGAAGVAAIYFAGSFVYDKFFVEKDELLGKVGSVAVQLNDDRGVDQTVVAYNSIIQKLYDSSLKENPTEAKLFNELFIKSCVLEERDQTSAYYYATLNNDDYICFQANADGYISATHIWIDENHRNIIMPVLAVTLHSVVNVSFDNEFNKQIIDKLVENNGNVMFHSLQAKRDFKVSSAKKGDKYQYTIQAFID